MKPGARLFVVSSVLLGALVANPAHAQICNLLDRDCVKAAEAAKGGIFGMAELGVHGVANHSAADSKDREGVVGSADLIGRGGALDIDIGAAYGQIAGRNVGSFKLEGGTDYTAPHSFVVREVMTSTYQLNAGSIEAGARINHDKGYTSLTAGYALVDDRELGKLANDGAGLTISAAHAQMIGKKADIELSGSTSMISGLGRLEDSREIRLGPIAFKDILTEKATQSGAAHLNRVAFKSNYRLGESFTVGAGAAYDQFRYKMIEDATQVGVERDSSGLNLSVSGKVLLPF